MKPTVKSATLAVIYGDRDPIPGQFAGLGISGAQSAAKDTKPASVSPC
jgi:hypothetical protein